MSRIFISYRRSDSISEAGRIYDYLYGHFGRDSIFKDVDDIDAGDDYRERLKEAVGKCQILLAVIGRSWLTVEDGTGNRRLDNPADWVRLEIETALKRNIRVIPILLEGVEMPPEYMLPESLRPFAYRNAARVRYDPDFRRDMERVSEVIQRHFEALREATAPQATQVQQSSPASLENEVNQSFTEQKPDPIPQSSVQKSHRVEYIKSPKVSDKRPLLKISTVGFEVKTIARIEKTGFLGLGQPEITMRTQKAEAEYYQEDLGQGVTLELVAIPGGMFQIGSPREEDHDSERPQHGVTVKPFLMGKYPVTQAQWRAIAVLRKVGRNLPINPSWFKGNDRPVERVSWEDAVEFCQRLSQHTERAYRLPSEAEWEYACRAGTATPFHFGETITADLANYDATEPYRNGLRGEYRKATTNVGSFSANTFGLYDMHGNIWEWCTDHWHSNYEDAPTDGRTWPTDNAQANRVLRGGSWLAFPRNCRSASRSSLSPDSCLNYLGFRVSCMDPEAIAT
ncbi:MAG: SUMF1/EgtB/PvdO family nonheme iron enzyme [Phormidesmis sp.]